MTLRKTHLKIILMAFLVMVCVLGMIFALGVSIYNSLVRLKNQVDRSWANIDVILKQRFDEIPQLIQIIEQFVGYEKKMIQQIIDARSHYGTAQGVSQKIDASKELSSALRGVLAIGEAYPELKSNENFVRLQTRISELENQLADRREHYNESVTNLNTRIEQFPDMLFARQLGYQAVPFYKISSAETLSPNLKINLG